jgi:hypothetical protein
LRSAGQSACPASGEGSVEVSSQPENKIGQKHERAVVVGSEARPGKDVGGEPPSDGSDKSASYAPWDAHNHTSEWEYGNDEGDTSGMEAEADREFGQDDSREEPHLKSESLQDTHRLRHMIYEFPTMPPIIQQSIEECQSLAGLLRAHLTEENPFVFLCEVSPQVSALTLGC